MRNYFFVHDYAALVVTASTKAFAEQDFKALVKTPEAWRYTGSEEV